MTNRRSIALLGLLTAGFAIAVIAAFANGDANAGAEARAKGATAVPATALAYASVNLDRNGTQFQTLEALATRVDALIVTLGGAGSHIYTRGQRIEIPGVEASAVVDPTGCGDAYRAGLLHGISSGMDWPIIGRLASLIGAIKIAQRGGQNHRFTRDEIAVRYREVFGSSLD